MKKLFVVSLGAFVLSLSAHAAEEVANRIVTLNLKKVSTIGSVLKRTQETRSQDKVTVGIPVEVEFPNACTQFVGQEDQRISVRPNLNLQGYTEPGILAGYPRDFTAHKILVKGSQNSLEDACIEILPLPHKTQLTVQMLVNYSLPSAKPVDKIVTIGDKLYVVSLDPTNDSVTIRPVH